MPNTAQTGIAPLRTIFSCLQPCWAFDAWALSTPPIKGKTARGIDDCGLPQITASLSAFPAAGGSGGS
eukprot:6015855-Alexandrium_andersonii.AAC.1